MGAFITGPTGRRFHCPPAAHPPLGRRGPVGPAAPGLAQARSRRGPGDLRPGGRLSHGPGGHLVPQRRRRGNDGAHHVDHWGWYGRRGRPRREWGAVAGADERTGGLDRAGSLRLPEPSPESQRVFSAGITQPGRTFRDASFASLLIAGAVTAVLLATSVYIGRRALAGDQQIRPDPSPGDRAVDENRHELPRGRSD